MTLNPTWRNRLFAAGAAVAAVWLGIAVANGQLLVPSLIGGGFALFLLARLAPWPLAAVLVIAVNAGYILGNRGFAQLYLSPSVPLLPAEMVLLVGGGLFVVQGAMRRELPFRREALNFAVLAWMGIGVLRIGFDTREYGGLALRDFALVYYAVFFFLAQGLAREARARGAFDTMLRFTCGSLLVLYPVYAQFPDFFFDVLAWRGTPLIYYKGDLVATSLAIGAVLLYLRFEERKRWWQLALALALAGSVLAYNSRAAMLGLGVATGWLLLGGYWRFAAAQAVAGVLGVALILAFAAATRTPWQRTPLFNLYERVVSIADPMGVRTYQGSDTFSKGDNNLYRAVWWRAVFDETMEGNPYLGLGFGHDLAARFVRLYYPDNDEFNVRSPHNVLLTVFARMGAVGLAAFLAIIGLVGVRTWQAVRGGRGGRTGRTSLSGHPALPAPPALPALPAGERLRETGLWCTAWIILTSACLGVVLEGPMGAVVFWTVLGFASGRAAVRRAAVRRAEADATHDAATSAVIGEVISPATLSPAKPALPSAAARPELLPSP